MTEPVQLDVEVEALRKENAELRNVLVACAVALNDARYWTELAVASAEEAIEVDSELCSNYREALERLEGVLGPLPERPSEMRAWRKDRP